MPSTSIDIAAVDLFCGAAGLSLGLRESGIRIAAGLDMDPACRYPFEENIGSPFVERDILNVCPEDIEPYFTKAAVRVLAGCAPCRPFSGYTAGRGKEDQRWQLLLEFLRLAKGVRPEIVTLENVSRLANNPLWKRFTKELCDAGYHVAWGVLDAARYGVPQSRQRLVLVGSLFGAIDLPTPSGDQSPTVREAIGALPPIGAGVPSPGDPLHSSRALTNRNLARIRSSRQAGTWREWPEELRVACHSTEAGRTYPSVYGRMSWDRPSPTITTQFYGYGNGRFGHPEQDRAITLRDGAALQSFPSDFKFAPPENKLNFRAIGRLIRNAVPPSLTKAIGRAIVKHASAYAI